MPLHRIESLVTCTVWKVERQPGDTLSEGDTILIVESMKMEIPIDAPAAGVLLELRVADGDSVTEGQLVAVMVS